MQVTLFVVAGLTAVNLGAFLAFAYDKHQAARGGWRIRESTLLLLALFGGWGGAKLGQQLLRHKTRKEPFRHLLNGILLLQILIVLLIFSPLGGVLAQAG